MPPDKNPILSDWFPRNAHGRSLFRGLELEVFPEGAEPGAWRGRFLCPVHIGSHTFLYMW
jgi:hypothetical protein